MTILIYDEIYNKHDTGLYHPENSLRIVNTVKYLKLTGTWQKLDIVKPRVATNEEIETVHSIYHREKIAERGF